MMVWYWIAFGAVYVAGMIATVIAVADDDRPSALQMMALLVWPLFILCCTAAFGFDTMTEAPPQRSDQLPRGRS